MKLRLASRTSELALYQTKLVQKLLVQTTPSLDTEIVGVKTKGDQDQLTKLQYLGQTGVFTRAIDIEVLENRADVGVHSLKDYPSNIPEGLEVYAILERDGFLDAFIPGTNFNGDFSQGLQLLSGSPRREAQWRNRYPQHSFSNLRGNMDTRLAKIRAADGGIISLQGLARINKLPEDAIALDWMIPAPAQGLIAIIGRVGEPEIKSIFQKIHHTDSGFCADIERRVMQLVEAGCAAPLGVLAQVDNDIVQVKACLHSLDGSQEVKLDRQFADKNSENIAQAIAKELLEKGGKEIMQAIKASQARDILCLKEVNPAERELALAGNIKLHDVQVYEIEHLQAQLTAADAIIISSPNALPGIIDQLEQFPNKAFVVGERAEKELKKLNYQGEVIGFNYALELIKHIADLDLKFVFPCAEILSKSWDNLPSKLEENISFIPTYKANLLPLRLARKKWDGVAAFSSRALEHLQKENQLSLNTPIFCVGKTTASTASTLGFNTIYIAKEQNTQAVIQEIKTTFNDQK